MLSGWRIYGTAAATVACALAACTFDPRIPEGKVSCTDSASCPTDVPICVLGACHRRADGSGAPDLPDQPPAPDASADLLPVDDGDRDGGPVDPDAPVIDWPVCDPPVVTSLGDGLVAYLRLDDGPPDPIITDSSPNAATVNLIDIDPQIAWTSGRFGRALALPGGATGGYVTVGPSVKVNGIGGALSVSAWIKFPGGAVTAADETVVSRRAAGAGGYHYIVGVIGNRLRVRLHTSNALHADLSSNQPLPAGTRWIHVAMTYLAGVNMTDNLRLFVDGKPFGTMTFPLPFGTESTPILVGAAEAPTFDLPAKTIGDRLGALIDEVAVYQRVLSADEVRALACGAQPIAPSFAATRATRARIHRVFGRSAVP